MYHKQSQNQQNNIKSLIFCFPPPLINSTNTFVDARKQGWIKCGSREHRSQEMTRKIEEIITLGYEEK